VRATILAAGGLACAGAAMTIAAFAGGGQGGEKTTAAAPTTAPARADRGAEVFAEQGCGGCHTFAPANARGGMGPDLALSLRGKSKDYVLQSIVDPDAVAAENYGGGGMPTDFAQRIDPRDLNPLVAYLMKGAAE
jgi:mono/diheme cytochrome c family protein